MSILYLESVPGSGDAIIKALEEAKMGGIVLKNTLAELRSYVENAELSNIEMALVEPGLADAGVIEVCTFIDSVEAWQDLPILLLNRGLAVQEIASLATAGIDDYVLDPANTVELLCRVRMALKLSQAQLHYYRESKNSISRLVSAAELANRESQYDSMTGLIGREYFMELLVKEWKRAYREERALSLIFADIDNFKSYQRICGDDAGELCIIKVGRALANELKRPGDIVSRFEGDCFAVLLPETDNLGATVIAEIMRSAVGSLRVPHPASSIAHHVTISLGAASTDFKADSSPETLMSQAQLALQCAKQDGRNRVENLY